MARGDPGDRVAGRAVAAATTWSSSIAPKPPVVCDYIAVGRAAEAFLAALRQRRRRRASIPTATSRAIGLANQTTMLMTRVAGDRRDDARGHDATATARRHSPITIRRSTRSAAPRRIGRMPWSALLRDKPVDLMLVIGGYNSSNTGESRQDLRGVAADASTSPIPTAWSRPARSGTVRSAPSRKCPRPGGCRATDRSRSASPPARRRRTTWSAPRVARLEGVLLVKVVSREILRLPPSYPVSNTIFKGLRMRLQCRSWLLAAAGAAGAGDRTVRGQSFGFPWWRDAQFQRDLVADLGPDHSN